MTQRIAQFSCLPRRHPRAFTLIELLVVMGIIAVLGVISTITFRLVAKDAKLSSGKNTISAVLDNARGMAMKYNRIVMVVFRPQLAGGAKQRVEVVTTQFTGESSRVQVGAGWQVIDRFTAIPNVPNRVLPEGIKVAGPAYGSNSDASWNVLSQLPKINQATGSGEAPGRVIGVMFDADGSTITQNSNTDSSRVFVDFDNGGKQEWGLAPVDYAMPLIPGNFNTQYFLQAFESDEPFIDIAPFIAVFDDDEAREACQDPTQWDWLVNPANADVVRANDYATFIGNNVDPIFFNRYTGVAMK